MKGVCLDCSFQDRKSKIGWPHWFVSGEGLLAELSFMAGEPVYGKDHIQTGNQYRDKFRGHSWSYNDSHSKELTQDPTRRFVISFEWRALKVLTTFH